MSSVVYDFTASGLTALQRLDYAYNTDGSRASVTWTNGTNVVGSWSYGYDAGGRLTSVTSPWNETTTFAYDGEGKLTSQTNPNTTSTVYTYNQARGWPTGITHKKLSNPFAAYTLAYDSGANTVGLPTGVQEHDGSQSIAVKP